jgi:hypothetical protein
LKEIDLTHVCWTTLLVGAMTLDITTLCITTLGTMTLSITKTIVTINFPHLMLSVVYVERHNSAHYAERHSAERRLAECRGAFGNDRYG